ncbi:MAG: dihydrofolate reductase family protein [Rubrobacteraceae bacterium]|nr:dihydrofolate reductase family protein [Rubrobacteraceae bacterium]
MREPALRLYPAPGGEVDPGSIYADLDLPAGDPYLVFTMVSTVDGKAAQGGRANPIGSDLDHLLMRRIRSAVDAVMSGAGTLRAEGVDLGVPEEMARKRVSSGLREQPLQVIVTGSGELPLERRIFREAGDDLLVIVSEATPEEKVREISRRTTVRRVAGDPEPEVQEVVGLLRREFGVRRLAVEGGPSLNHSLVAAGLADELFLTLAPKVIGGSSVPTIVAGEELPEDEVARLRLLSVYLQGSELYLRYRFTGGEGNSL